MLGKYKLLDSEIPNLCADRIDYSLRSLTPKFARTVLNQLEVIDGKVVCTNPKIAKDYAYKFLALQNNEWGSLEGVTRYYHFSEILKLAIKHKVLTLRDFNLDDIVLTKKMAESNLNIIVDKLHTLRTTDKMFYKDPKNIRVAYKKLRHIDPKFLHPKTNKIDKLSNYDKEFKKVLEESKVANNAGVEFTPWW